MNKATAHLYLPLVQALADGELQIKWPEDADWQDCTPCSRVEFDMPPECYRRKPKPKMSWYRVAEMKTYTALAASGFGQAKEEEIEISPEFVCWLTERIEYEAKE